MKEQKKKQLIILLLVISCLISGYMLLFSSKSKAKRLRSIAQVDSLLHEQFSLFDIPEKHVSVETVKVDSAFSRKKYQVDVMPDFSKTQFHAELNDMLHPYDVITPSNVNVPEKSITIQLIYQQTIIRTIMLRTDEDLKQTSKHAF